MSREHTPLPWRWSDVSDEGRVVLESLADGLADVVLAIDRPCVPREADAALIVRSVNLLPEALAVLRAAAEHFEGTNAPLGVRVRAVLAKADAEGREA